MGKSLTKILPFIGIILFAYILYKTGMQKIIESFAGISFFYLLIAFLFLLPVLLLQTYKWFVIMQKQKIRISFFEAARMQLISVFYGFVTPARLGSFIKIAYLQEKTHNLGRSASSVVIDRMFDLLTVLILAGLGSLLVIETFSKPVWIAFFMLGIAIFSLFFLIGKRTGRTFLKIIYEKMLPKNLKARGRKSFHSFYDSIPSYRFMLFPLLLNVISWLTVYSQIFFIAKALGISVSYHILILILPISTLVSLLPITIAGLGTREASLITLLGLFNIPAAKIVTMSLSSMIIANVPAAIAGFVLSIKNKGKPLINPNKNNGKPLQRK